jgi:ribosome-associated protein YbcJ (S4-like RNA binding protein)
MHIDWSKAPEGSTHFHPANYGYVEHWVKIDGEESWFCVTDFESGGWVKDLVPSKKHALIAAPEEVEERRRAKILNDLVSLIDGAAADDKTIAQAIYDAGYRKP